MSDQELARRRREKKRSATNRSLMERAAEQHSHLSPLARGMIEAPFHTGRVQFTRHRDLKSFPRVHELVLDQRDIYMGQLMIDQGKADATRMKEDQGRGEALIEAEEGDLNDQVEDLKRQQVAIEREVAQAQMLADRAVRERGDKLRCQREVEVVVGREQLVNATLRDRVEVYRGYRDFLRGIFEREWPADLHATAELFDLVSEENRTLSEWVDYLEEIEAGRTQVALEQLCLTRDQYQQVKSKAVRVRVAKEPLGDASGGVRSVSAEVEKFRGLVLAMFFRLINGDKDTEVGQALVIIAREMEELIRRAARLDSAVLARKWVIQERVRQRKVREREETVRLRRWAEKIARSRQVVKLVQRRPVKGRVAPTRPATAPAIDPALAERQLSALLWLPEWGT